MDYADVNLNSIYDVGIDTPILVGGEPGLPGIQVYLDLNQNGSFDGTDISTVTSKRQSSDAER